MEWIYMDLDTETKITEQELRENFAKLITLDDAHDDVSFNDFVENCLDEGLARFSTETVIGMLLREGYPYGEMAHHESDLYVFVNDISTRAIDEYCKVTGYNKSWHFPVFIDQITGKPMYDCVFQWYKGKN